MHPYKSGWSSGNHLFSGAPQNCGTNIPVIVPCDFPLAISKALDTISDPKNRLEKSSGRNFPGEVMGIRDVFGFLSMPRKSNGSSIYRRHGLLRVHLTINLWQQGRNGLTKITPFAVQLWSFKNRTNTGHRAWRLKVEKQMAFHTPPSHTN